MALRRLTAEFGMGSGLIASPKATRPAKNSSWPPCRKHGEHGVDANIDAERAASRDREALRSKTGFGLFACPQSLRPADISDRQRLSPADACAPPIDPVRFLIPSTIKPNGRLVPVSSTRCRAYTPGLSTWSSSTALQGDLVLRLVSRLDAFSGYPFRT